MNTMLNLQNLDVGINVWRTEKTSWPIDFHNTYYQYLHELKRDGLNESWWRTIVDELWGWRAIRPITKATIYQRGLHRLNDLQRLYAGVVSNAGVQTPNIARVSWAAVSDLYNTAHTIKNVSSPVFGSKLCHFMLPNVFPVIDRDVIGLDSNSYEHYWRFCQTAWTTCPIQDQDVLIARLQQAIGTRVVEQYPWSAKITEICLIGSRSAHPQRMSA